MTDTLKVLFTAKVHTTGGRDGGCSCFERPNASLQGLQPDVARELIEPGHRTWSYSKATRGNIDVLTNLIKAEGA
jgi:osmotically inducible protein OsmC